MIVSPLYQVTRKLLALPSALLRGDAATDAAIPVLRHENAVLLRQVSGPVRHEPADRPDQAHNQQPSDAHEQTAAMRRLFERHNSLTGR